MSLTLSTSLGDLKIELCASEGRLPQNFLALAASGAYNGTELHRNIAGFMVQGGDTSGTGKGGESAFGGLLPDELDPAARRFDARGVIGMATAAPNQVGSQFFITYAGCPHLDAVNSVVGRVIGGAEVLDAMERAPVAGKRHRPVEPIKITGAVVHVNPWA